MAGSFAASRPLILPVILAGGAGARLAPISTPHRPKPFVPLSDGESLLTKTLRRVGDAAHFLPPLLVGRADDRFALLNHARAACVKPAAILLETTAHNTAIAVAIAVEWAKIHEPDAVLAILPADHAISTVDAWHSALFEAKKASVEEQKLCLLSACPTEPNPDFGYIEAWQSPAPWQQVRQFIEKPNDPGSAIERGARWNMGQFIAPTHVLANLVASHALYRAAAAHALQESVKEWEFTVLPAWPADLPALSFDRAIVETSTCIAVAYEGAWRDLGTLAAWEAETGLNVAYYNGLPTRVDRPWGYFDLLESTPNALQKRLVIYPDCRLSRQRHQHRNEHWTVLEGRAHVEKDESMHVLEPETTLDIPAGSWHRLSNRTENPLIIHEIQSGKPDEQDIERSADDYGRL